MSWLSWTFAILFYGVLLCYGGIPGLIFAGIITFPLWML